MLYPSTSTTKGSLLARARIIEAALCEAGHPEACVFIQEPAIWVAHEPWDGDDDRTQIIHDAFALVFEEDQISS